MSGNPHLADPRWTLAEQITDALRRRWSTDIQAVGVHGSLAHGDTADGSDIDLVVVTYRPTSRPRPGARRVNGVVVDLTVVDAEEYLRHARTLTTSWPLAADQYLTTKALYDPQSWHDRLRDTHLARLAEAGGGVFADLARDAWCQADAAYEESLRLAQWHDTSGALLTLGNARLAAALVEGLLSRTYFRSGADAVRRSGLGEADLTELGRRLAQQAQELANRGRPVDATISDLVDGGPR